MMMDAADQAWHDVPIARSAEWYGVFDASQEGLDLAAPCPLCGACTLHRYFHAVRPVEYTIAGQRFTARGDNWEWCSSCRAYAHTSVFVPAWWSDHLEVDERQLTSQPAALEEARRRQRGI